MSAQRSARIITLAGGVNAKPHQEKCYRPGCRRYKRGYITRDGGFYNDAKGEKLGDLREQDFACAEHGVGEGMLLHRDSE